MSEIDGQYHHHFLSPLKLVYNKKLSLPLKTLIKTPSSNRIISATIDYDPIVI
eukprot:10477.XXX_74666_74824_1 [CDS] Oithona nana genome sequencing.